MTKKPTVVLGASTNPERYSYIAAHRLMGHGHPIWPVGVKKGSINGVEIINEPSIISGVDTITLYLNPTHQENWQSFIMGCQPKRVIFNPGTENPSFAKELQDLGIEATEACTLVLLSTDQY